MADDEDDRVEALRQQSAPTQISTDDEFKLTARMSRHSRFGYEGGLMSDRAVWKMLHLLYTLPPGMKGLTDGELLDVGIDCYSDTIELLLTSGAAQRDGDEYVLAPAAKEILRACVVANRRWPSDDLRVDDPVVFVAMPFREPWSKVVYTELIKPAVEAAHLECVRGDKVVRIGDVTKNVWGAITRAGLVVAEVSAPNANVFYELGLAHALANETRAAGASAGADWGAASLRAMAKGVSGVTPVSLVVSAGCRRGTPSRLIG